MNRSMLLSLIAIALALYGVYVASYVPGMLVGPSVSFLLIGFSLQAACAICSAVGVWRLAPWATLALVLLAASVAATWLFEAFVLGIVPYLRALLVAGLAAVAAFVIAAYLKRQPASLTSGPTRPAR
jgi:hypothetical protein